MKTSKSTIVRTLLAIIVLVNIVLERLGIDILPTDEYTITLLLELGIEIAILVIGFWKNNSFTENAKKADEYLKKLKAFKESE